MLHAHESARSFRPLLFAWVALCLPLLFLGYGSDYDAWRIAETAKHLWQDGIYTPSRSLGFPLFEILITPLVAYGNWLAGNLFSLLASCLIFLALRKLAVREHFHHPLHLLLAFMFLPIFYKNAASTMDYLPALALMLWAYQQLQEGHWQRAALLIGLSAGFRPTALLFLIPALWFIWQRTRDNKQLSRALAIGLLTALLAYSPILFAQGFIAPAPAPRSSILHHFALAGFHSLRFLGLAQTACLLLLAGYSLKKQPLNLSSPFGRFHGLNLAVWAALFLVMPDEPEYLLPALPSLLFLLDRQLNRRFFTAALVILLSYHVIQLEVRPAQPDTLRLQPRITAGYTIEDIQDRVFKLSMRGAASRFKPEQPTLLMFGVPWITAGNEEWIQIADQDLYKQKTGEFYLSGCITKRERIQQLKQDGFRLIAWRLAVWDYIRTGSTAWEDDVEVVEDVRMLFSEPIRGKPLNER